MQLLQSQQLYHHFPLPFTPPAARDFYAKAVCATHEMAHQLIVELRKRNVEVLVAPYEADAQLAFLARTNDCQVVITEDSDVVVFGCPVVLFKLDGDGQGQELRKADLGANEVS